jgi:hypothetical protein
VFMLHYKEGDGCAGAARFGPGKAVKLNCRKTERRYRSRMTGWQLDYPRIVHDDAPMTARESDPNRRVAVLGNMALAHAAAA